MPRDEGRGIGALPAAAGAGLGLWDDAIGEEDWMAAIAELEQALREIETAWAGEEREAAAIVPREMLAGRAACAVAVART